MTTSDINYQPGTTSGGIPLQIVQVGGQTYVQVDTSLLTDELGISTVKEMERIMPPPDLPQPPPPGFVLIDIETFMKVGLTTGALSGVTQTGEGYQINSELFALSIKNDMHKMIITFLNNWAASLKKQSEDATQAAKKADIEASERAHEIKMNEIRKGEIKSMQAYADFISSGEATQSVFVMGSLTVGIPAMTTLVNEVSPSKNSALVLTVGAIADIGGSAMTAAVNFMASSLMYGVQVFANLTRLGGKNETIDKKVPEEYAKKTLALINSRDADVILGAMAGPGKEGQELVAMTKVAMLTLPLMLAYRFETGGANIKEREGMTSHEMRALLLQEFADIPKDDIKSELAASIQRYLGQISGPVRELLIERILAYVDSKPPLGELLDGGKAIQKIKDVEQQDFDTLPI